MLSPTEAMLESKCERIARIMTREYGVEVRIGGNFAYIDLEQRVIVLPALSDDAVLSLQGVLDGFLDHECAHAILTRIEDAVPVSDPVHPIWNTIEDVWIEREMGRMYVGCAENLERSFGPLVERILEKWDETDPLNRLMTCLQLVWRGMQTVEACGELDAGTRDLLILLEDEIADGYVVASTEAAVELARRIQAKIATLATESKQSEASEDSPTAEAGDSEGENEGEASEAPPGACGDAGDEQGEDADTGEEEGGFDGDVDNDGDTEIDSDDDTGADTDADTDADEDADSGSDSVGDGDSDSDIDSDVGGAADMDVAEDVESGGKEQAAAIQDFLEQSGVPPSDLDRESQFNQNLHSIEEGDTSDDPENYLVFSEDYDTEVTYDAAQRLKYSAEYHKLKEQVYDYVGPMANALAMALIADTQSRWVGGARQGRRWNKRRMPSWYLGGLDDRVWNYLEEGKRHDTAVTMLWDCSGSMGRNNQPDTKSALARLAAIAMHEALKRAGIPHEILGFNTGGARNRELSKLVKEARDRGEDLSRYSRLDRLDNRYVFVPYGSSDGRALVAINGSAANRDGECVLWAAKRLAARPEERKVLIVASDGLPSGAIYHYTEKIYLQRVVRQVINAGIELLGIGIMNKSVRHYYPKYVLLEQAADIPTVVIRQLANLLLTKGTDHGFPEFCKRAGIAGSP